jgi:carbon starvation protein CstA
MVFVDFNVVWRYFAWTNQTLAVFTLWAGTIWLYKKLRVESLELREVGKSKVESLKQYGYLIALLPALFMTMVCSSYILIAPEGLHLPVEWRWLGYVIAGVVTLSCLGGFMLWARKPED